MCRTHEARASYAQCQRISKVAGPGQARALLLYAGIAHAGSATVPHRAFTRTGRAVCCLAPVLRRQTAMESDDAPMEIDLLGEDPVMRCLSCCWVGRLSRLATHKQSLRHRKMKGRPPHVAIYGERPWPRWPRVRDLHHAYRAFVRLLATQRSPGRAFLLVCGWLALPAPPRRFALMWLSLGSR